VILIKFGGLFYYLDIISHVKGIVMVNSQGIVLHQYRTTVLWYLVPLFFFIGCLLLAMAVGLPLLLDLREPDTGTIVSIGIAAVCGAGMPVLSIVLVLFVPAITTLLHPGRGLVELVYKRPLWSSRKEFPLSEIADVRPILVGERGLSLALILRSGKSVRIELSSTSDRQAQEKLAAEILLQMAAYRQGI
jgi:hypothetical protein